MFHASNELIDAMGGGGGVDSGSMFHASNELIDAMGGETPPRPHRGSDHWGDRSACSACGVLVRSVVLAWLRDFHLSGRTAAALSGIAVTTREDTDEVTCPKCLDRMKAARGKERQEQWEVREDQLALERLDAQQRRNDLLRPEQVLADQYVAMAFDLGAR